MFNKISNPETAKTLVFNKEYKISTLGNVVNIRTLERIPLIKENGFDTVNVVGVKYRLIDLIAIHFKYIYEAIPKEQLNRVEAFYLDEDNPSIDPTNIGYRFRDAPLECLKYPNYFHVPEHCNIVIDVNGEVINSHTGVKLNYHVTKPSDFKNTTGGYHNFCYTFAGRRGGSSRHRALMMTFKGYPDNVDRLQVNHINGVPGDDRFENLEWVTPKGNILHAVASGLRTQNRPIEAYNVHTKETKEYPSIASCALDIGISDTTVGSMVNKTCKLLATRCGYTFKYLDDETPFISDEEILIHVNDTHRGVSVKVRDCETLDIKTFDTVAEASRWSLVNSGSIEYRLNKKDYSPLFGFQFIPLDMEFPDFNEEELSKSLTPSSFKIDAKNILTNEVRQYDSVNLAAKELEKHYMPQRLRDGKQPLYVDGWTFKYENDEWNHIEDPIEACNKLVTEVIVKNHITGEETLYSSSKDVFKATNIWNDKLRELLNKNDGTVYKNYSYRRNYIKQ